MTRAGPWKLRVGERRLVLLTGDMAAAAAGMVLALFLWGRFDFLGPTLEFVQARAGWFLFLPLLWPLVMVNLYDLQRASSWPRTVQGVLLATAVGTFAYLLLYFVSEEPLARRGILYFLAGTAGFTLVWRWAFIRVFTASAFLRRVLIVGAGESGRSILQALRSIDPPPYAVLGLVDDDPAKKGRSVLGVKVLGDNSELLRVIEQLAVSDLIVAILGPMNGEMFQALLDAQERGVGIIRMPVAYEELLGRVPIHHLESDWLLRSFVDEVHVSGFYLLVKRLSDVIGALAGLAIMAVFLPWAALAIWIDSGRPVLFSQTRSGQGGRVFRIVKLRTMRQDAEADGTARWTNAEDPRTTRIGRILRRTHLDEFPQFWSVFRGDMSLVGPRPERPEMVAELEKKIPFYRARLLVKPGITGWAQVNYGKGASFEGSAGKLEYDLYYIKHRSLWLDLWIILRTAGSVLRFQGV